MPRINIKLPDSWIKDNAIQATEKLFDEWMASTGHVFRSVKERETLQINYNNQSYFIKKHWGVGWKEVLKNYFSFKKPIVDVMPEWQSLCYLKKIGLSAPKAIGFGIENKSIASRRSFIIMEDLKDMQNLETFSLAKKDFFESIKNRRHWIKTIAQITRRLHDAGIYHRDLYICHFLFNKNLLYPNAKEIYLIDLHRAQIKLPFPKKWRIKDLAALYFSAWPIPLTLKDKLFFIRCYTHENLNAIFPKQRALWLAVAKRSKKVLNRCYTKDLRTFFHYWQLQLPWFEPPNKKQEKSWSGVSIWQPDSSQSFFIKRQANYFKRSWRHLCQGELTVIREYHNIKRLTTLKIPTLTVHYFDTAYLDRQHCGILITEALHQHMPLDAWLKIHTTPVAHQNLLKTLAALLARLHQNHFVHGALYPKHIFVSQETSCEQLDLRLIDLENMRWKPFKIGCAFQDLNKLNRHLKIETISTRIRLKFLKTYLHEAKLESYYTLLKNYLNRKYKKD